MGYIQYVFLYLVLLAFAKSILGTVHLVMIVAANMVILKGVLPFSIHQSVLEGHLLMP